MVVHLFLNNNKALDFLPINSIKNGGITLELSLDDGRDVFVLWLPSENGYCQCAFVCYVVDSDKPVIISPESLPMVV